MKLLLGIWTWTVAGALLSSTTVYGQNNLIPNWSFEELDPNINGDTFCPGGGGQVSLAELWNSAYGSVDYFNACSNEDWPNFGVPNNIYGQQLASSGEAYTLILSYVNYPGYEDSREFLWMELSDSLKGGQGYYWEAQISLADSMNFATSRLGVLFTKESTRFLPKEDFFNFEPQVENPKENLLNDKESWSKVSGQFVAEGGEKFMTIGFFNRDVDENIQRVSNFPYITTLWETSSYYVDDVILIEDNSIGIAEQEQGQLSVYPNPTTGLLHVSFLGEMDGIYSFYAYTLDGRNVRQANLSETQNTVTLAGLSAGIYFVKISSLKEDGLWRGKIILSK